MQFPAYTAPIPLRYLFGRLPDPRGPLPRPSNPHFAYADADSITHEDHNHPLLLELQREGDPIEGLGWEDEEQEGIYEPEFAGIDRGIIGRAPAEIIALGNNAPQPSNINAGDTQYWVFPNETLGPSFTCHTWFTLSSGIGTTKAQR
jgi:hypothetical protein